MVYVITMSRARGLGGRRETVAEHVPRRRLLLDGAHNILVGLVTGHDNRQFLATVETPCFQVGLVVTDRDDEQFWAIVETSCSQQTFFRVGTKRHRATKGCMCK